MKGNPKGYCVHMDGTTTIAKLYATNIVTVKDGVVTLDTGGHNGPHTRKCMNLFVKSMGIRVFQKDWNWFLSYEDLTIPFENDTAQIKI